MSSYRFCRTDDIGLLVDALNRCWHPHFPDEEPMTPAAFKRWIRDLQVWCSSCMVAFSGSDPIAVLIGAKRATATLIHRIAVHPDHLRQGHGRHLLTSLSSKLAILGPPRIVTEVPEALGPARALFVACGYVEEARLTDFVWPGDRHAAPPSSNLVIPITVEDLAANGLLGADFPPVSWARSVETLMARKDELAGFASVCEERIEAFILYIRDEIVALSASPGDGEASLAQLISQLRLSPLRLPRVHPGELASHLGETLGFQPAEAHVLLATRARSA